MGSWFFVSDLHGQAERYSRLFHIIADEKPAAVLLGGDLLPSGLAAARGRGKPPPDFLRDFVIAGLTTLRASLGAAYPRLFVILGNDDPRVEEEAVTEGAARGVWEYLHERQATCAGYDLFGYAYVPPTPFVLKDWERYDVSRHVDPGCVSPEEGHRTVPVADNQTRYGTIQDDLATLFGGGSLERAVCLFHAPPYKTHLDRAALDGKMVDQAPLDVHVGSVAIRRFIEERQPLVTLHGHIHESARLTGAWREQIGRTYCFSAAHDGPELALVRFDPADPAQATRTLL
jgi:Icc-related predicted phosphoesterase